MHNVSWGTKGLTQDPRGHVAEERRLRRLRDTTAGSIVAVTAVLVGVGSEYPGAWVKSESSVIEVFTLIFLVVLSVAAATWACAGGRALLALGASVAHFASGRPRQPSAPRAVELAQATPEA